MTSEVTAKVRMVRCPKCSALLEELADVPLYKCGGCGTVLQAKKRQNKMKTQKPGLQETGLSQKNEMKHVSRDTESSSSSQKACLPSRGLCSLDEISGRKAIEASSSADLTRLGNEQSSPSARANTVVHGNDESDPGLTASDSDDSAPDTRERSSIIASQKLIGESISSDALTSPSNLDPDQFQESAVFGLDGVKSTLRMESMEPVNPTSELSAKTHQDEMKNQNPGLQETVLSQMNEGEHVSGDVESSRSSQEANPPPKEECDLDEIRGNNQNVAEDYSREQCAVTNLSNEAASSYGPILHGNEEPSLPVVHENNETGHDFRASAADGSALDTRGRSSMVASESVSSDTLRSPSNLEPEQFQGSAICTMEAVNPSSELSDTLRDFSNSSTAGSCHKYDGSISSYDGIEDPVPNQHLHWPKTFEVVDFSDPEKRLKGNKHPVSNNPGKEHLAKNTFSVPLHKKKNYNMKCERYDRSWMRLERDEFQSRSPLYARGSQSGYEFGSPSCGLDEFKYSSNFQSPDMYDFDEQDRVKLLRMVWELQGQLNKRDALKGKESGTVSSQVARKEKQMPACYRENFHASNPQCHGTCGRVKTFSQQHNFPRKALSGEAASNRQEVDRSCLHCCPHDWRWSVQLFPHCVCCAKGQSQPSVGHGSYSVYGSTPSSPLHNTDPEFYPGRHSMKSDELRHQDHRAVNSHSREELYKPAKKHLLPVAGGAPFLTCYCCLKLLQLPADFLLFRKRCHRLRCNACSEVLKFSLVNRAHIIPYTPKSVMAPPPSEVDYSSGPINSRSLELMSQAEGCAQADPVSCSDDYGCHSLSKSISTDDKLTPLFQGNADSKKMVADTASEPMETRKENLVFGQSQNESRKNTVKMYKSVSTSPSKSRADEFSSEIEELQASTSPLHRLMGYSSPTEVINGCGTKTSSDYADKSPQPGSAQIGEHL